MVLSFVFSVSLAFAGEGFFDKSEITTPFEIGAVSPASLMVEEVNPVVGHWKHIGNAFFVTSSGYVLTNYHIANSCVKANAAFFKAKYGTIANLSRQGFYSENPEGLPCRILRANRNGEIFKLQLISLPPIAEQPPARSGQEANGPYYDFAILKVTSAQPAAPFAFLGLQDGLSEAMNINDDVYLVGYPAATQRSENSQMIQEGKYKDVQTGDYRISLGQILAMQPEYYYHPKQASYFYTSTDGGPGSSGSALLNSNGKLVALILGSGDDKSSVSSGCIMKYKYCDGVALYLRTNVIIDTIRNSFPELGLILF